jgi:hypothetical protein
VKSLDEIPQELWQVATAREGILRPLAALAHVGADELQNPQRPLVSVALTYTGFWLRTGVGHRRQHWFQNNAVGSNAHER